MINHHPCRHLLSSFIFLEACGGSIPYSTVDARYESFFSDAINSCGSPCSTTECPYEKLCGTTVGGDNENFCLTITLSRELSCPFTSLVLLSPFTDTKFPCGNLCRPLWVMIETLCSSITLIRGDSYLVTSLVLVSPC